MLDVVWGYYSKIYIDFYEKLGLNLSTKEFSPSLTLFPNVTVPTYK